MNRFTSVVIVCGCVFLINSANASAPNADDPTTFLGPTIKAAFATNINELSAYSVSAEAGLKNKRLGGTVGWYISENQRIKFSVEYLSQSISYSFFDGNTDRWGSQGAIGADYGYELADYLYSPLLGISAYFSHAPSQGLNTDTGSYVNNTGIHTYTDLRHIAGVNVTGVSPGLTLQPWVGTRVGVDLNYDSVRYNTNYLPAQDARGLGATVRWNQAVADDTEVGLSAAMRQPYNNYSGYIAMTKFPYLRDWTFGCEAAYTIGKNKVPDSYNIGLSADYYLEKNPSTSIYQREAAENFLAWATRPAVYVPQVLGVADERVT